MTILLGCIADDFTGGTDLAGMLVKAGMRTVQLIGVPDGPPPDDVDAVVIALKSRTNPAPEAVAESLAALAWLEQAGCRQFYFKYCSTFDSTPAGNIGPVTDALMQALDTGFTIACPAFPANGRTIYKGNLFVGDVLLNESGMRDHPLTPMTDANLVRVLQRQAGGKVGLASMDAVGQGAAAIVARFAALREQGCRYAVVDALSNQDLMEIGAACDGMPLLTGGSGLALGLPDNFRRHGLLAQHAAPAALPASAGARAVIAGSCSVATQLQVERMRAQAPSFRIDPLRLAAGADLVREALDWAAAHVGDSPLLVYATSTPETVRTVQAQLGVARAGALVEEALAAIAAGLVDLGVGRMIVAGGETSGAVVKALGVHGLRIGPEIAPGVPWTMALRERGAPPLALALKSGNFGGPDFFLDAWEKLA
ncbi:MAG: 3-oxo-tetronate kinase [Pseudomonadota bacterium]